MRKKPLLFIGIFGVLFIVGGFIFNPSFVGHFTHDGSVNSSLALVGIFLIQFYMITLGGIVIVESIVFNFLPAEKRTIQYLLGICIIGLVIIITGAALHPSFIEHQLNLFRLVLPQHYMRKRFRLYLQYMSTSSSCPDSWSSCET